VELGPVHPRNRELTRNTDSKDKRDLGYQSASKLPKRNLWKSHRERRENINFSHFRNLIEQIQLSRVLREEFSKDFESEQKKLLDLNIKDVDEPLVILLRLLQHKQADAVERVDRLSTARPRNWEDINFAIRRKDQLERSLSLLRRKYTGELRKAHSDIDKIRRRLGFKNSWVPPHIDPTAALARNPAFYRLIEDRPQPYWDIIKSKPSGEITSKLLVEKPSERWVISPTGVRVKIGTDGKPRMIRTHDGRKKPIERHKNISRMLLLQGDERLHNFIKHLPPKEFSRKRRGLFCACLYREAEKAKLFSPKSKKKWAEFFKIDRKTLDKRLKELNGLDSL
jgi:hypothetical protein